jgi:hypothetical protein
MSMHPAPVARVALVLAFIGAPMSIEAQQPATLRLTIEAARPTLTLGEPLYLTARLLNEGKGAARVIALLKPTDGLLVVSMSGPQQERLGFVPLSVSDTDDGPVELAPGRQFAATFPAFFGAKGWTMRTPGAYTLKARFTVHDGSGRPREIESAPIVVRVGDGPTALARTLLNDTPPGIQAGKFLLWNGGDHLTEGAALLSRLQAQAPGAPINDHVHLALGRSLTRPFKNYAKGVVRPPDFQRAVAELEQARDLVLPAYLTVQKYISLAAGYQALGRSADAARAAGTARTLIGERAELSELLDPLNRAAPPQPRAP